MVVDSYRNDSPRQTPAFLFGFCFFSPDPPSSSPLQPRLIKIMSLNRTKSEDQSHLANKVEKTVMSARLSNQNTVVCLALTAHYLLWKWGRPFLKSGIKTGPRNVVVLAWPFQSIIYTVLTSHVRSTEGCMPCGLTTVFLVSKYTEVNLKKLQTVAYYFFHLRTESSSFVV